MSFNHIKNYECVCGKEFNNSQAYNGHKSHCKDYQMLKHGDLATYYNTLKLTLSALSQGRKKYKQNCVKSKTDKLNSWLSEKHICEYCGKVMTEKYGSGRFCSKSCSKSRHLSNSTKNKISKSLRKKKLKIRQVKEKEYMKKPKLCKYCNQILPYDRRHLVTCGSNKCLTQACSLAGHKGGTISAESQQVRSKNEIAFCELCENYFKNVEHNKVIFFGYDADVIIHDIKYAILWNGIWHYKKMSKTHDLEKIKRNEQIRLKNIKKFGYTPYVIKDLGSYDLDFVKKEFNRFIEVLKTNKTI